MAEPELYRFGEFALDVHERRLSRGGESIALAPKAYDVLVHLVRDAGRLVTKADLLDRVWAETVVEEGIISVQIAALRKSLGDDHASPRYVETVARSGYRFIAPVARADPAKVEGIGGPSAARSAPRSIAVLPFADMSQARDQEWLADGLAEGIINLCARVPELKVTARTSALAFRGREQDIAAIADALRVRAILEGSVRRIGERLRVTVHLIDAESGYGIWSERYDREVTDILALEDDIARAVGEALKLTLSAHEHAHHGQASSFEAYEAYLKGRHFGFRMGSEALRQSRIFYERPSSWIPNSRWHMRAWACTSTPRRLSECRRTTRWQMRTLPRSVRSRSIRRCPKRMCCSR